MHFVWFYHVAYFLSQFAQYINLPLKLISAYILTPPSGLYKSVNTLFGVLVALFTLELELGDQSSAVGTIVTVGTMEDSLSNGHRITAKYEDIFERVLELWLYYRLAEKSLSTTGDS